MSHKTVIGWCYSTSASAAAIGWVCRSPDPGTDAVAFRNYTDERYGTSSTWAFDIMQNRPAASPIRARKHLYIHVTAESDEIVHLHVSVHVEVYTVFRKTFTCTFAIVT